MRAFSALASLAFRKSFSTPLIHCENGFGHAGVVNIRNLIKQRGWADLPLAHVEDRLKTVPRLHQTEKITSLTCIWWSFAMLHTQVAAYLLHSASPSEVSLTAACSPPPRVAAARVSAFAVRLQRVITARRLQSTSGQEASWIRDAGHPDCAIMNYRNENNNKRHDRTDGGTGGTGGRTHLLLVLVI